MTTYARTVTEVPDHVEQIHTQVPWTVELHEILAVAATLTDAGYDTGDVIVKVDAISTALDTSLTLDIGRYLTDDLLSLDPAEVADRVRQAGIDLAAHLDINRARRDFDTRLALDAATSLRNLSDTIITEMRTSFDPALKKVRAAATAGLTPHTDTTALLTTGSDTAIKAYRQLLDAVTVLDGVANLRMQMANVAGIGSHAVPIANFLVTAGNTDTLDAAQATWRGEVEVVQVELPVTGSYMSRVAKPRLGGRWLALVAGGYDIRLNTAAQANAVLDGAA